MELKGGSLEIIEEVSFKLGKEISLFMKRNMIECDTLDSNGKISKKYTCCNRCLKAYLLERAREWAVGEGVFGFIEAFFNCETGHDGYFLDGERVLGGGFSLHSDA